MRPARFFDAGDGPVTETGISAMRGEVWISPVIGIRSQSLSWKDAERANQLPADHKDPMDRMLIATALGNDMTVITDDSWFAAYGVKTIW